MEFAQGRCARVGQSIPDNEQCRDSVSTRRRETFCLVSGRACLTVDTGLSLPYKLMSSLSPLKCFVFLTLVVVAYYV